MSRLEPWWARAVRWAVLTILAMRLTSATTPARADVYDIAVDYVVAIHDKKTACNPCITRARAREYVTAIRDAATEFDVPFDVAFGHIGWESAGFQNTIDKTGSGTIELAPKKWCFGMGKLKVTTARDIHDALKDGPSPPSGHDLLYDYQRNIRYSVYYLKWCLRLHKGHTMRALNTYKAGPAGERRGHYIMRITMPWGDVVKKTYAECVIDYSIHPWLSYLKTRRGE